SSSGSHRPRARTEPDAVAAERRYVRTEERVLHEVVPAIPATLPGLQLADAADSKLYPRNLRRRRGPAVPGLLAGRVVRRVHGSLQTVPEWKDRVSLRGRVETARQVRRSLRGKDHPPALFFEFPATHFILPSLQVRTTRMQGLACECSAGVFRDYHAYF